MLNPINYVPGFRPLAMKNGEVAEEGENLVPKLGTFYVCDQCRVVLFIEADKPPSGCPVCN
jgi:rubrerythrin